MPTAADVRSGHAGGKPALALPPVVFGTSALGNLYRAMAEADRRAILAACLAAGRPAVLDCAGKYGAGLALEAIGRGLRALGAAAADVVISNKLGWRRVPLAGSEPTFEPGAWVGLDHDAVQDISAEGILRCWEQGCALLGAPWRPALVSVHDPDEFVARGGAWDDVLGAYRSLDALKRRGEAAAVGVGAKDWTVIRRLAGAVDLDWAMLACSFTILRHPPEVLAFLAELHRAGVVVINSAVFHGGFLTGGDHFDYRRLDPADAGDRELLAWRERFRALCDASGVDPAAACVRFACSAPGIAAIALNTHSPARVPVNAALAAAPVPDAFWTRCKDLGLIRRDFPFLG